MSLAARLGRLTPVLTGKERALVALRARNAGQTPDPELRRALTPEASREYNRYAALIHVANGELGMLCRVLGFQVECLEAQADRVFMLEEAAGLLVKDLGETLKESHVRNWRSRKSVTVPIFLRGLAAELREGLGRELALRWEELSALEVVWQELATDFEGEDPVEPVLRTTTAQTREILEGLAQRLGRKARLRDPDEAALERCRDMAEQALTSLQVLDR